MQYILVDIADRMNFYPFSLTRSLSDCRVGVYTFKERWDYYLGAETEVWRKLWEAVKTKGSKDNMIYVVTDTSIDEHPITNLKDIISYLQKTKDGK